MDGPEKELVAARAANLAKRFPEIETSERQQFIRKIIRQVVTSLTPTLLEENNTS